MELAGEIIAYLATLMLVGSIGAGGLVVLWLAGWGNEP